MAVRTRVRRGGGVVLLLALLFLVGQGLGWLPGGRSGGGSGDDAAGTAPAARAGTLAEPPTPKGPEPRPHEPTPAQPEAAAPAGGSSTPTAPASPAAASGQPGGIAALPGTPVPSAPAGEADGATFDDRGNARRAIVQSALASDRIGDALATIERLAADRGAAAVVDLRRDAARALAAAGTRLRELLAAGDVLGAEQLLQRVLQPRSTAAAAAVAALCTERGWPPLAAEGAAAANAATLAALPAAELNLRDRAVRLPAPAADAAPLRTRVVAQGEAGVTLRIVGKDGVTFPTVPPWRVAPETVTAAEATELGLFAAAAGATASARLWCACALTLAGEPSPRLQQLRAALR